MREMKEIDEAFNNLYSFFKVSTITELAKKLEMSQPAVTNWHRRNSRNAIKRKCREIGIYNEIFQEKKNKDFHGIDTSLVGIKLNLRAECQKYGIQITTLKNKRLLYLLEHIALEAEINKQTQDLENDLIDLYFKYYPLLNKDLFPIKDVLDSFEKES